MTDPKRTRFPLYLQVMAAVVCGALLGVVFGDRPIAGGVGTAQLGELGMLVIKLLKALAIPLVLFAIIDALCRSTLSGKSGAKLLLICALNVAVAFAIAFTLVNTLRPGALCRDALQAMGAGVPTAKAPVAAVGSPLDALQGVVPASLIEPLAQNNIVAVVLLALLTGAALRKLDGRDESRDDARAVAAFVGGALRTLQLVVSWVVKAVPLAVLGLVAQAVGKTGLSAFTQVLPFLGVVLLGLAVHAFGYYVVVVWWVGGKSPRAFLRAAADAVLTGFSTNSSLAALPLTLKGLEELGVSPGSARMSACVGTNFNNDGATLYEVLAALVIAQALGLELSFSQQAAVLGSSVVVGMGVTGIPGASLVMLPVVLAAAGIPPELVGVAIAFLVPIDWFVGRCRTMVNVLSDMTVAVLLDAQLTSLRTPRARPSPCTAPSPEAVPSGLASPPR